MGDSKAETSTTKEAGVASLPSNVPLSVSVEAVRSPQAQRVRRFWIGAYPDSPKDQVTIGGVTFPKRSGHFKVDEYNGSVSGGVIGSIVELTDAKLAILRADAAVRVGRIVGDTSRKNGLWRCSDFVSTDPDYIPEPGDFPLADLVWIVPIGEVMPSDWRSSLPTTALSGKKRAAQEPAAVAAETR